MREKKGGEKIKREQIKKITLVNTQSTGSELNIFFSEHGSKFCKNAMTSIREQCDRGSCFRLRK